MSSALMRDEDEDGEGEGGFLRHEGFFGFDGFDVEEMDERSLRSSYRSREPTWYKGKQERTSQQGRNITHANSTDGDERHGHAGATTALDMSEARSSSNLLSTSYLRDSYTETRSSLDNLVTQNLPYEIKHDDSRPCVTNPSRTLFGVSSPNIQHLSRKDEVFSLGKVPSLFSDCLNTDIPVWHTATRRVPGGRRMLRLLRRCASLKTLRLKCLTSARRSSSCDSSASTMTAASLLS
mmetsp:Transcript_34168/g.107045  ORF Transcript_34168/g.107045 Transcript_34168/m.107045 type:complete len:237 (-) Transcript_34168:783-1493(-)